jgi:hypothetical protein
VNDGSLGKESGSAGRPPVADATGLVEESILERVYSMFEIFLIHSFVGAEHQSVA